MLQLSRYSEGLWAGRPGFKSLQTNIFFLSIVSSPTLEPNSV